MNSDTINGGNSNLSLQDTTVSLSTDKSIELVINNNKSTSYSEGIQSKVDSKSLDDRKTEIQSEAKKMRKTALKRSKTILAVGLVAGAIAGIVGGALALAGIVTMIPFIIAGISVFVGIFGSIASLPKKEQIYEARLTVEYANEALDNKDNDEGKAEALRYLSDIIKNMKEPESESPDDRNNLLRIAVQTILVENEEAICDCLINGSKDVKSSAIALLNEAMITNFVKNCLNCSDNEVIISTLNILGKMIESEDSSIKDVVNSALTENKEGIYDCLINGSEDVKSSVANLLSKAKIKDLSKNEKIIQGLSKNEILTDIQGDELLIIKTMLYSKDSNVSKTGINVLTNTINKNKDTVKKLFEKKILDLGIVKKMIHNESTRNEMLDLLWLMSKDEDLKKVVNKLVGSDITDKLTKLNPQSTTEEKDKIIEEIKGLKLGIPEKLNAGDIVYKKDHDFGKNLTILQQSEENIENAKKLKNFFKNQETVNELKDRFSKNDGLHHKDGRTQECFLQYKDRDFNKETNKIDSKEVANQAIRDFSSGNLVSIECGANNHIRGKNDASGDIEKDIKSVLEKNETKKCDSECIKFIKNNVKDVKDTINTLCSFPGQATGFTISNVINGKKFAHSQMSYNIAL